jgi:hypothetical protein
MTSIPRIPANQRVSRRVNVLAKLLLLTLVSRTISVSCFSFSPRPRIRAKIISPTIPYSKTTTSFPSRKRINPQRSAVSESSVGDIPDDSENKIAPGIWPCFDELDARLIRIALPIIANFAISPLIGAVDLFWINRMGNALAVAGQAAANQVFNSAFWLASFLPSGKFLFCWLNTIISQIIFSYTFFVAFPQSLQHLYRLRTPAAIRREYKTLYVRPFSLACCLLLPEP